MYVCIHISTCNQLISNQIGTGPRFVSAAEDKVCGSYNNVRGLLDEKTKVILV